MDHQTPGAPPDGASELISHWLLANNHQMAAFNKPPGLPVQPDKTADRSLLELGEAYCRQPLFLVHRIDRPTSGLVILAKKKSALAALNEQFREREVEKTYLAVVGELPAEPSGEISHYLLKDGRSNKTRVLDAPAPHAEEARLRYEHLGSSERYHLLKITLLTGRHHQVRAQLAQLGSPIRGDVKYGFKRANADRGIDLHSWRLRFRHPVTQAWETLTAPPPATPVWQAFATVLAELDAAAGK
jgi:23S rRNA pseudouridine1911/1915/1917 synthase